MRVRSLTLAALGVTVLLGSTLPALADRHDDRDHRHDEHHDDWHRGYVPPPVYVAPPAYSYYAPPPVYNYGPPGVSIGINIP